MSRICAKVVVSSTFKNQLSSRSGGGGGLGGGEFGVVWTKAVFFVVAKNLVFRNSRYSVYTMGLIYSRRTTTPLSCVCSSILPRYGEVVSQRGMQKVSGDLRESTRQPYKSVSRTKRTKRCPGLESQATRVVSRKDWSLFHPHTLLV